MPSDLGKTSEGKKPEAPSVRLKRGNPERYQHPPTPMTKEAVEEELRQDLASRREMDAAYGARELEKTMRGTDNRRRNAAIRGEVDASSANTLQEDAEPDE